MDVAQKKQEVLESIASQPLNVVYIRVDVCDQVQLADLLKADFVSYLRGPANSGNRPSDDAAANTDSLHEVCINLAKQRALLQGASVGDVLNFKITGRVAACRHGPREVGKPGDGGGSLHIGTPLLRGVLNLSDLFFIDTQPMAC